MGCWAIGGPWKFDTGEAGWGEVDDQESIRGIHAALAHGVNVFDTAANYGAGHSERILGEALAGRRPEAVIISKFGYAIDEARRVVTMMDVNPTTIRQSCEDSLRRLATDVLDLFLLHVNDYPAAQAPEASTPSR